MEPTEATDGTVQDLPNHPIFLCGEVPALAQQQEQLKNQSSVVPAKPNLTEQQQRARGDVLANFEQEIISNDYDEPMGTLSYDEMMPFRRFQSNEYQMKIDAQTWEADKAASKAKAEAKQALLDKLGITADEAKLLLG